MLQATPVSDGQMSPPDGQAAAWSSEGTAFLAGVRQFCHLGTRDAGAWWLRLQGPLPWPRRGLALTLPWPGPDLALTLPGPSCYTCFPDVRALTVCSLFSPQNETQSPVQRLRRTRKQQRASFV